MQHINVKKKIYNKIKRKSRKRKRQKSRKRITSANSTPVIINKPGQSLMISGLISCVGIGIEILSPAPHFKVTAIIGGHFVTPKMYNASTKKLTKSGIKFMTKIKKLLKKNNNQDIEITFYIGKSAIKNTMTLAQMNALDAIKVIKAYLSINKSTTIIGESKIKLSTNQ